MREPASQEDAMYLFPAQHSNDIRLYPLKSEFQTFVEHFSVWGYALVNRLVLQPSNICLFLW